MAYALVSTQSVTLTTYTVTPGTGGLPATKNAVTSTYPAGTIVNLIEYDGVAAYTPPPNTRVALVPDTAQVGDTGY